MGTAGGDVLSSDSGDVGSWGDGDLGGTCSDEVVGPGAGLDGLVHRRCQSGLGQRGGCGSHWVLSCRSSLGQLVEVRVLSGVRLVETSWRFSCDGKVLGSSGEACWSGLDLGSGLFFQLLAGVVVELVLGLEDGGWWSSCGRWVGPLFGARYGSYGRVVRWSSWGVVFLFGGQFFVVVFRGVGVAGVP